MMENSEQAGKPLSAVRPEDRFREIYRDLKRPLLSYLHLLTGNPQDAEDLLQDCFQTLWRDGRRLLGVEGGLKNPKAFLFQSARNKAISIHRKKVLKTQMLSADLPVVEEAPDFEPDPRLRRALSLLPGEQRELIQLKLEAELSFREIAALLGILESTAKARYRYALEKLREFLAKPE